MADTEKKEPSKVLGFLVLLSLAGLVWFCVSVGNREPEPPSEAELALKNQGYMLGTCFATTEMRQTLRNLDSAVIDLQFSGVQPDSKAVAGCKGTEIAMLIPGTAARSRTALIFVVLSGSGVAAVNVNGRSDYSQTTTEALESAIYRLY